MAQSEISIQSPADSRWGVESGSSSDVGTWQIPSLPAFRHQDPPWAAGQWAAPNTGPAAEGDLRSRTAFPLHDVLSAWRAVERDLRETSASSPDWQLLQTALAGLRASYHQLYDEIRRRLPMV